MDREGNIHRLARQEPPTAKLGGQAAPAGADPGPACFGKGNDEATITDAHLYLGRLNPATYLGGELSSHGAGIATVLSFRL